MAKRKNSVYSPGKRSDDWLKIKRVNRQEVVIVGFTEPANARRWFGALLTAVFENNRYRYAGKVGSGFSEKDLEKIFKKLKPLITKQPVLEEMPQKNMHWVKPKFLAEVTFTEWTPTGRMRHPVFKGLRTDKKPEEVSVEEPSLPLRKK